MQDLNRNNCNEMEIEVNEKQSQIYNRKLEVFNDCYQRMQRQYQSSSQKIYYLVSTKFIEQWKSFCKYNASKRIQPEPMNSDIVDPETKKLQEGLVQGQNFEIVNKKIFDLFEGFPVFQELRRVAYGKQNQKRVPIYTIPIKYLTLSQTDLNAYDRNDKDLKYLKLLTLNSLGLENTIQDLKLEVQHERMISKAFDLRVWKHKKDVTLIKFYHHIKAQCEPLSYNVMKIRSLGKKMENQEEKIGNDNYEEGDYFIIQIYRHDIIAIYASDEGKCGSCTKFRKLNFPCNCKEIAYCSQECVDKDKLNHNLQCKWLEEQEFLRPAKMVLKEHSRRGLVGLQNMGNTCFMNSCLQCLSHTLLLTQYFLNNSYAPQINLDNPIGSKGKLVQAYANFIKHMWCQEECVFRPYRLKSAISDINKMFSGYLQHDSQELFSFLVDGIHEDLNRIKKKPYVQSIDSSGRSDEIVSKESWLAYIQRNQSIITDTMVGQYKSKVTCPDCGKQSITFDPYITVTLPIPQKWFSELKLYVLYSNFESQTARISITFTNKNLQQIYEKVSKQIERKLNQFRLYILNFNENIYPFHSAPRSELFNKLETTTGLNSGFFCIELSPQEQNLQNFVEIVFKFSKFDYNKYEPFWYKRPFFFNFQTVTGLDVFKRILKYLYDYTYIFSQRNQKDTKRTQLTKTYEQYQQYMLKNRPFTLYLCSSKIVKHTYSSKYEIQFENETKLEDNAQLKQLIDLKNLNDYEINIKFTSKAFDQYYLNKLNIFEDKPSRKGSNNEQDNKNITLDECFQALQYPEQLEKGNQWYCPACKEHKLASKQLFIYKTPEVLILHLKRFKAKGGARKQKNEAYVEFPLEINMQKYITSLQPINAYIPYAKQQGKYIEPSYNLTIPENPTSIYELYAISNHYGSLSGGHYTAFAKNGNKWYSFNDSSVSSISQDKIKGSGAYILFYRRKPA